MSLRLAAWDSERTWRGRSGSRRINSLLIANAHHVVAQQYLLIIDLVDERNRNVARVQYALGSPIVIHNWSTWQNPRVHDRPYLLQVLVNATRKHGLGHYRARV